MGKYLSPEQSVGNRNARMDVAAEHFHRAAAVAQAGDLVLRRCDDVHYQLFPPDKSWLLNIYPSNCRIYSDPNKPGPFLGLPFPWTLPQVVQRACELSRAIQIPEVT